MSGLRFSIREILLLTLIVALLLTWGMQTYLRQWPTAREKALMQERLEARKGEVDMQEQMMATGMTDSSKSLRDAQLEALAAELELCTTRSERIEVLKRNLAVQQKYEKLATARYQAAAGTMGDVLAAKADRLKAEIDLERAKAGR
jgi:hypothetical protein